MALVEIDPKFIREVVSPTWERVLACLTLALILLAGPSAYLITNNLTGRIIADETASIIHHALSTAGKYPIVNTVIIVIFWSSIALLVYLVYLVIAGLFTSTYNEVVTDTQYVNVGSWAERLSGPIGRLVFILALLGFLVVSWVIYGKCLVPFTASLHHWQPQHLVQEALLVLALALDLYLIRILIVLTFSVE